jgi:hypothetical protein
MSYNSLTRRRSFDIDVQNNTYAGKLALPFLTPALKANDTVANNYVRVLDGIHYKAVLPVNSSTSNIQTGGCDYNDGANLEINEAVLTLSELAVNETLCRKTVYPTWHGAATGRADTDVMTQEFKNFTLGLVASRAAATLENYIWLSETTSAIYDQGFLSNDGAFDEAGVDASKLAGCTEATIVSLTAANVIAQIGVVYAATASSKPGVLGKADCGIYINTKTAALYRQGLATAGGAGYVNQVTLQAFEQLNYLGTPIRVCPGMPDDCIIVASQENLVFGTNLGTDLSVVKWIPAYEYDGSDNIKIVMRMAVGAAVGVVTDVVVGATFWT